MIAIVGLLSKRIGESPADEAIVLATLAGALFGGAAILLGNWTSRFYERAKAAKDLEHRRAQMVAMITAELVNVAAGLIGADEYVDAAWTSVEANSGTVPLDMGTYLPRDMPFTFSLTGELWILEQPAIDALVTLRSNLAVTRGQMEETMRRPEGTWRMQVIALAMGIGHTMDILAECFERIAPNRKLTLHGKTAELASVVLRANSARRRQPYDQESRSRR